MKYDIPKRELTLAVDDSQVKVIFECDPPQTSIWHYVFSALSEQELYSVQSMPLK